MHLAHLHILNTVDCEKCMWVSRSDRRILRLGVFKNPKWATTTISLAQKSFESQKIRKIPRSQRPKAKNLDEKTENFGW